MSKLKVTKLQGISQTNLEITIPANNKLIVSGTINSSAIQSTGGVSIWTPDLQGNISSSGNLTSSNGIFTCNSLTAGSRINLPVWTTSTRPTTNLVIGVIGFNSDLNKIDFWDGSKWLLNEILFYDEGTDARSFVSNWNDQQVFNMTTTADLGNCWIHGWGGSPRNYTLSLSNIPTHTEVKYECFIHMVDSWDNETCQIYTTNSSGSEVLRAQWTKVYNTQPSVSTLASGSSFTFKTGQTYSYRPWGNGTNGNDGYASFSSGWYSHTASTFSARHYTGLDQAASDEAYYISHVKLYTR
jgi:hypothetical protein